MKEVEKIIERSKKEMEQLKEKFNNTPADNQNALKRLDERIEKLRYYIMGLETAKIYIERETISYI